MEKQVTKGKLTPLLPPTNGTWLSPEEAARFFKNGRGIKVDSLMKKIYAGKLNGFVRHDYLGWHVFIPETSINSPKAA